MDAMAELFITHGSYFGIMLFLILTGCGLPIPEEVPILAAGVLSSQGLLNPWLAFAACLTGALIGDCIMYSIGHYFGHGLLKDHPWFAKLLSAEREEKFEFMLRKHGLKVLFVARFMVGVRSPVYLSAGVLRVGFWRFLLMDLLCATAVVGLFFWLSFAYGEQVVNMVRNAEVWLTVVIVSVILVVAGLYYRRVRRRMARYVVIQNRRRRGAEERAKREVERCQKTVA